MNTKTRLRVASVFTAVGVIAACGAPQADVANASEQNDASATEGAQAALPSFSPYVDAEGNISRPTEFLNDPDWLHIGSWAVVNENGEGNGLHNVYTTRDAVASFKRDGVFPDGAVLVKEVNAAVSDQLTTGRAHWSGDHQVWFVMVKDQTGRFPDNPLWGDGWGWALFKADAPDVQVATEYKQDCLGCHVPVKDTDWLYLQGYPVLEK